MHRTVSITSLLFWAVTFGGAAHLSTASAVSGPRQAYADQHFANVMAAMNTNHLLTVMLLLVAVLFAWAAMAATVGEHGEFREVEAAAYGGGILAMTVAVAVGVSHLSLVLLIPAVLAAMLAVSAAASRAMPETALAATEPAMSQTLARRMAISAAHNSMLSRISGRSTDMKG